MLPQARYLHDAGYDLLLFDWRALGASDGSFTSYGYYEKRDLKAALDYAAQHGNGKIGVVGYSTGAAVAILEGSQDRRIRAIVADSCYATLDDAVSTAFPILNPYHPPAFPFAPLAEKIAELETGLRTSDLRPIDHVAEFAPRPILFIYGSKDQYVPPADSVRLYGAAREPKQLLEIPNAGHPSSGHEAFQVAPDLYKARVLAFFAAALQP